jgi:membrane-associated phospholipid phosphatase
LKLLVLTCWAALCATPTAAPPLLEVGAAVGSPEAAALRDTVPRGPYSRASLGELRFTAGTIDPATPVAWRLDLAVARGVGQPSVQQNSTARVLAGALRFLAIPGSLLIAGTLYGTGELGDRGHLADLGMHTGQAVALAGVTTLAGKVIAGRARPNHSPDDAADFRFGRGLAGDRYQSFPSAHTAAAFATSAFLGSELSFRHPGTGAWLNPLLYGSAALAGVSRVYHHEHWLTDVAAGAAIGTAAGRATAGYHRNRGPASTAK